MLAMRGTAPFGSSTPAPARYQEQSAPEASGWTTKHMQALTPIWITHSDEDAEAFCVRFSPDDTLLAAGCGDGVVRVFHTEDGRLAYKLEACASGLPTTAVRFRPTSAASKTRNVLLVANSDGTVQHWHVTSSRCLHTITEEDNQVYALDYAVDEGHAACIALLKKEAAAPRCAHCGATRTAEGAQLCCGCKRCGGPAR